MRPSPSHDAVGPLLLGYARACILHAFGGPEPSIPLHSVATSVLNAKGAAFVTITREDGSIRGCIGSVDAHRTLASDIRANAVAAAFLDPRSAPLRKRELHSVAIELSVLGPLERLTFSSEQDALTKIRPDIDGLVFGWGPIRSVLLPQVWGRISSPKAFVEYLKTKAGLSADFWAPEVTLDRFTVERWRETRQLPHRPHRVGHGSAHTS